MPVILFLLTASMQGKGSGSISIRKNRAIALLRLLKRSRLLQISAAICEIMTKLVDFSKNNKYNYKKILHLSMHFVDKMYRKTLVTIQ